MANNIKTGQQKLKTLQKSDLVFFETVYILVTLISSSRLDKLHLLNYWTNTHYMSQAYTNCLKV